MPTVTTLAPPLLVDATWLAEHLRHVRVIDTRRSSSYLDGHIPGACSLVLDTLLVEQTTQAALDRLGRAAQVALAARGISPEDHVVLIDDADGSAALGALVCELAGLTRVSVLHGGVDQWRASGRTLAPFPSLPEPVSIDAWQATSVTFDGLATIDQLAHAVADDRALVLDTRSQLEHEGIVGTPCCARRGSIPGSTHLEWTAFLDMSGMPHAAERVAELAAHLGADQTTSIVVTCHAGHRAAVAARVLRSAGYEDVRVSLGSWHEWAARAAASGPAAPQHDS